MSAGDAEACGAFSESGAQVDAAMDALLDAGDAADEATVAAYADAQSHHTRVLQEAAERADSVDLAVDLADAADLWVASNGDDVDAGTAYYLTAEDIEEFCS